MKTIDNTTYLTIGEVANKIDRIPQTLKNWLNWYESQSEHTKQKFPLPAPITTMDTKGTRYFREEDITMFEQFRDNIKYGTMSDFSVTRWGKRGKDITERKEEETV